MSVSLCVSVWVCASLLAHLLRGNGLCLSHSLCVCGSVRECVWEYVLAVSAAMFFSASSKAQAPVRTLREIEQAKVEVINKLVKLEK